MLDDMMQRSDNPAALLIPVMVPRVLPEMVSKLGLLKPATVSQVITAYSSGQEIAHLLLWKEGVVVESQPDLKEGFVKIIWNAEKRTVLYDSIRETTLAIAHAIDALDAEQ
jgi:hypothetical protein